MASPSVSSVCSCASSSCKRPSILTGPCRSPEEILRRMIRPFASVSSSAVAAVPPMKKRSYDDLHLSLDDDNSSSVSYNFDHPPKRKKTPRVLIGMKIGTVYYEYGVTPIIPKETSKLVTYKTTTTAAATTTTTTNLQDNLKNRIDDTPIIPKKGRKVVTSKKRPKRAAAAATRRAITASLRDDLRNKIAEMGGTDIMLVIEKSLFQADILESQNRLFMPIKKLSTESFLTEDEAKHLAKGGKGKNPMEVPLLDTKLEQHGLINLTRWYMNKVIGASSSVYALNKTWNNFVKSNDMKVGDDIQVWSFRVNAQLHLALIRIIKVPQE